MWAAASSVARCRIGSRSSGVASRAALLARHLSTPSAESPMAPAAQDPGVVFEKQYYGRIVNLKRHHVFNAIDATMLDAIVDKFMTWVTAPECSVIIFKSDHPKAFCAGGDVKAIVKLLKEGKGQDAMAFFRKEYTFNHALATSPKPLVSYMNGITMGGGVGLAGHAAFRVATEKTLYAMPETAIGLFPDVGGSFLLGQLESIGVYLALTGRAVGPAEAMALRLASHYVPSHLLPRLTERLCELVDPSLAAVNQALEEFAEPAPALASPSGTVINSEIFRNYSLIKRVFSNATVGKILIALKAESKKSGPSAEFALGTLNTLAEKSPLSLHMALRQLRESQQRPLGDWLQREWILANTLVFHPDFTDGVTTKLIEKRGIPDWQSKSMTAKQKNALWEAPESLTPLPLAKVDFVRSPYSSFCLPSEGMLVRLLQSTSKKFGTFDEVVEWLNVNWPIKAMLENTDTCLKNFHDVYGTRHFNESAQFLSGAGKVGLKEHVRCLLNIFCKEDQQRGVLLKKH